MKNLETQSHNFTFSMRKVYANECAKLRLRGHAQTLHDLCRKNILISFLPSTFSSISIDFKGDELIVHAYVPESVFLASDICRLNSRTNGRNTEIRGSSTIRRSNSVKTRLLKLHITCYIER